MLRLIRLLLFLPALINVSQCDTGAAVGSTHTNSTDAQLPVFDSPRDENESLTGVAVDRVPMPVDPSATSVTVKVISGKPPVERRERRRVHHRYQHQVMPGSLCDNNGTFVNGKCECPYPFVGVRCTEYACGMLILAPTTSPMHP